jgi:hypothetical protein
VPETLTFRDIYPFVHPEAVVPYGQVRHGELDALGSDGSGQPREAFVHGLDDSLHELVIRVGIPNKVLQGGFQGFILWFGGCFGGGIPVGIPVHVIFRHRARGVAHIRVSVGEEVNNIVIVSCLLSNWLQNCFGSRFSWSFNGGFNGGFNGSCSGTGSCGHGKGRADGLLYVLVKVLVL